MKLRTALALVPLSLAFGLLVGAPSAAAQSTGWIRWGNWSPSAPEFDIYLYSFGDPNAETVIKHVRYGDVSSYMAVPTGQYTIAMRDTGAAATAPPTLSASVQVTPGTAYTIVSMGPASHLGVQVLKDKMSSLPGQALVRVVQESLRQHSVTVTDGTRTLGGHLLLGSYTGYLSVSPGQHTVHGAGNSESTTERVCCPPTPFTRSSCSTNRVVCGSTAWRTQRAARPCPPAPPRPASAGPHRRHRVPLRCRGW